MLSKGKKAKKGTSKKKKTTNKKKLITGKIINVVDIKKKKKKTSTKSAGISKELVLAITYDIWISGTQLSMEKKACITDIEIKETVTGSDVATLHISDPEFKYIEDNIFLEESKIKIKFGWTHTTYRNTFDGYISAIDIDFDTSGIPSLVLTCMDNTHRMNRSKKNKTFKKCTSADVVKKILKGYGYSCDIEKGYKFTKQDSISQSNQTDIEFITKLAEDEVHPFTANLVGKKFNYKKLGKLTTPKLTLTYRNYPHEIISFSPRLNKEDKKIEVKSASVNTKKKSISKSKGTTSKTTAKTITAKKGSATKNGSTSSKKSSGSYTYSPSSKSWSKKKK